MRSLSYFRALQRAYSISCCRPNEMIGKPDKSSNIRPLKFTNDETVTTAETHLRKLRVETQNWHHNFWMEHNSSFDKMKKEFIENKVKEKEHVGDVNVKHTLDPEEMAVFHRQFLELRKERNLEYDR